MIDFVAMDFDPGVAAIKIEGVSSGFVPIVKGRSLRLVREAVAAQSGADLEYVDLEFTQPGSKLPERLYGIWCREDRGGDWLQAKTSKGELAGVLLFADGDNIEAYIKDRTNTFSGPRDGRPAMSSRRFNL